MLPTRAKGCKCTQRFSALTHLPGNSGIQTPELHPSLSQALRGLGPDLGIFTVSPGHTQWPKFCWEPTAAWALTKVLGDSGSPAVEPATPKPILPHLGPRRGQDPGHEPLTFLARGTVGTHHLLALWDGRARRLSRARARLAVVSLACKGVAIETWQAALTGRALGVVAALADP